MGNHEHDIHFMAIVLILAFFMMTLSFNQVSPTANVVKKSNQDSTFLKKTVESPKILALSKDFFKNLDFEITKSVFSFKNSNIGGKAVVSSVQDISDKKCSWINLDNKGYSKIKAMTGKTACKVSGYDSCLMTNKAKTVSYYSSSDSSCSGLQFKDSSNEFGNCDVRVRTFAGYCSLQDAGDVKENSFTSVLCC
ncbi:hypothetical protein CMO90_01180 [Candidatus Woesearchaeota archaeon]|jgi:hypothetical protein|nr:hypothetical protein [Candidatus Woesearchaeota archaeon]|tara:strand:- start:573 stop:1154 length:582 start_codon:yes stop_codon:yes gene_type:complete